MEEGMLLPALRTSKESEHYKSAAWDGIFDTIQKSNNSNSNLAPIVFDDIVIGSFFWIQKKIPSKKKNHTVAVPMVAMVLV